MVMEKKGMENQRNIYKLTINNKHDGNRRSAIGHKLLIAC